MSKAKDIIRIVEEEKEKPATMDQAKKRWSSYTKSVLINDARASFRGGETWLMMGGYPTVTSADGYYILTFKIDDFGNVVAYQGRPPGVSGLDTRKMLMTRSRGPALGKGFPTQAPGPGFPVKK